MCQTRSESVYHPTAASIEAVGPSPHPPALSCRLVRPCWVSRAACHAGVQLLREQDVPERIHPAFLTWGVPPDLAGVDAAQLWLRAHRVSHQSVT